MARSSGDLPRKGALSGNIDTWGDVSAAAQLSTQDKAQHEPQCNTRQWRRRVLPVSKEELIGTRLLRSSFVRDAGHNLTRAVGGAGGGAVVVVGQQGGLAAMREGASAGGGAGMVSPTSICRG